MATEKRASQLRQDPGLIGDVDEDLGSTRPHSADLRGSACTHGAFGGTRMHVPEAAWFQVTARGAAGRCSRSFFAWECVKRDGSNAKSVSSRGPTLDGWLGGRHRLDRDRLRDARPGKGRGPPGCRSVTGRASPWP